MKKQRHDFKVLSKDIGWYDIVEDWELIESSFAMQYQIRLRRNTDMSWAEFKTLLVGIMADTPLGQIVEIRSTKDKEVIKNFTSHQRKIHTDWRDKRAKSMLKDTETLDKQMANLEKAMEVMFGPKTK